MSATRYELIETFDVTRVHPERDSITDLQEAVAEYDDGESTWTVEGSCVVFKRHIGSSLVPHERMSDE